MHLVGYAVFVFR